MSNYEFDSEEEARKILEEQGQRLFEIAKKVWQEYLDSYKPEEYVRTGKSMRSIKMGKVKKIGADQLGIEITWQDNLAYHPSVVSKGGKPMGNAIMLISNGWHAKRLEQKIGIRDHFTYYEGFDYLGKVVREFNNGKHQGIDLEIQWSGQYLRE